MVKQSVIFLVIGLNKMKANVVLKGLTLGLMAGLAATHATWAQSKVKEPVSIELQAFKKNSRQQRQDSICFFGCD
jgi:hypothetical protein